MRDRGVLPGVVYMPIFGADIFRPFAEGAPIGFSRGPYHRKNSIVLDREFQLQSLALIVGIGCPAFFNAWREPEILLSTADRVAPSHGPPKR